MDRQLHAWMGWLVAGLLWGCVGGCADRKAEYEPVPYGVYDSPLIASASPADPEDAPPRRGDSSRASAQKPPERDDPPDEWRGDPDQEPINDRSTSSSRDRSDNSSKDRPGSIRNAARYVAAVYRLNGVSLTEEQQSSIPALYRKCRATQSVYTDGPPAAGDLVFFHNTVDANDDGRNNDWYTHVGLVESARDGVVSVLSYRNGSVQTFRMSLKHAGERRHNGQVVNAQIRPKRSEDPPYSQYLAGQLFAGYCSLLGDVSELVVIDNWQPGMKIESPN